MENTEIKGIYAVKVGQLWVREYCGSYELNETPKSLVGIKEALKASAKTGGDIYQFTPTALTQEQIDTLRLASEAANE